MGGSRVAFASGIPTAPRETEAWRFFLVDADAPTEVKDVLRHFYMRYSGPAGMTEQDDMENWLYKTKASTGTIARRYPFNYQQSMGALQTERPTAGRCQPANHRTECSELLPGGYARYLKGDAWDPLLGKKRRIPPAGRGMSLRLDPQEPGTP